MSRWISLSVVLAALPLLASCGTVQKVWSKASTSKPGATLTKSEREAFHGLLAQRHVAELNQAGAGGERALTRTAVRTLEPYAVVPDAAWLAFRERVDARIDGEKIVEEHAVPAYLEKLPPDEVRWLLSFHQTPAGRVWWDARSEISEAMANEVNLIAIRDFIAFAEKLPDKGHTFKSEKFVSRLRSYYEFLGGTEEERTVHAPVVAVVSTDPHYRARAERETIIAHARLFARLRSGLKKEPTENQLVALQADFAEFRTSDETIYSTALSVGLTKAFDETQLETLRGALADAPAPEAVAHIAAGEAAFAARTNRWLGETAVSVLEELEGEGVKFLNAEGVRTLDAIRGENKEAKVTPPPGEVEADGEKPTP